MKICKIKEYLQDKWDTIYWGIKDFSFRRILEVLEIWKSYLKVSKRIYDFDYTGILEAERHQLIRTIDSITKYQSHVNWKRDVMWMKIALHCLNVITGRTDYSHLVSLNTQPAFSALDNHVWMFDKYVNLKTYKRFFPNMTEEMYHAQKSCGLLDVNLYEEKCWRLYHRIRDEHMREWWD